MRKQITKQQLRNFTNNTDIVLVSGSFDILHKGHKFFLKNAKGIVGDSGKLLVILLSDEQIKRRKGNNRPINDIHQRINNLSKIKEVDYILVWDEPWENLRNFLSHIKIKYLAMNSSDPGIENKKKIAKANHIKVKVFKRLAGYSTTNEIKLRQKHSH